PKENIAARFSDDEAKEYQCENCGAVLITEAETTATTCSFCGGAAILADRLSGHLAPAKVIPFTISKQEAEQAFRKWCKKGLLTPRGFMSADRIKSITGMYIPFWMFDLNSEVQVRANCTRVHQYEEGDYICTETEHFEAFRDINLDYLKIPVDASEKMKDELMDKLEPYSYEELKDFQTAYLAGYIAEKYNYTDE
ncbi:TFIIB-type zinc ribbon-containing protein, partial [Bacillus sp. LR--39]